MKIAEKIINPDLVLEEKIGYFDEEEAVAQLLRDNNLVAKRNSDIENEIKQAIKLYNVCKNNFGT
jgi:hypothetical protein